MLWAAFAIGFIGSLHCVGMCGPIILAMPVHTGNSVERIVRGLLYHTGRITTYAILGSVIGLFGGAFILIGYQQTLSIIMGILIIVVALTPKRWVAQMDPTAFLGRINIRIHSRLASWFKQRSFTSTFVMGSLNGILPCGLVYLAMAGALASGGTAASAMYMALFGLGTMPALLAIHLAGDLLSMGLRQRILKFLPVIYVALGVLFILRGLDLGIPYLSPEVGNDGSVVDCH